MATLTTGAFSNFLFPILRDVWGDTYDELPKQYDKYMEVEHSDQAFEDLQEIVTFGLVPIHDQGGALSLDRAMQGYKTRFEHLDYSMGFEVTRQLLRDDKTKRIMALPEALSFSVNQTVETICANILNRAFNASYTGADGVTLASTAHPIANGTASNRPANAVDFTLTGVQQMQIDLAAYTDSRGLKIMVNPALAILHPFNFATAKRVLGSDTDPTTANRAINPYHKAMDFMLCNFLTSNKPWFIKTDIPKGGLRWFWREEPEFYQNNIDDRLVKRFMVHFAGSSGWDNWRDVYASPGQ